MATIKIRYLTKRSNKKGEIRYFWQPYTELQQLGSKVKRQDGTYDEIISQAEKLNAELNAWRKGEITTSPEAHSPASW